MPTPPALRSNAPQPVRSLRDWLDHLAARGRVAVLKPNVGLKFEVAAYAKRLDGLRATVRWYLDHHGWWERVMSGAYRGQRLGLAS